MPIQLPRYAADKLDILMKQEGFSDVCEFLEDCSRDSIAPGICMTPECDYSTEVEPDQAKGWCEACGTNTVQSAWLLAEWLV